jgi:hypothetical protein
MTATALRDVPTDELIALDRAHYERFRADHEPLLAVARELAQAIQDTREGYEKTADSRREWHAIRDEISSRSEVRSQQSLHGQLLEDIGRILSGALEGSLDRFVLIRAIANAKPPIPAEGDSQ